MSETLKVFSLLALVLSQISLICGNYEAMQSPKRFFILEMGQSMSSLTIGSQKFQIESSPNFECRPRPLFGFQFFDKSLNHLPICPLPNIPPIIDRTFKNVSVSVGQPIRFDIVFTGFPKPVITFFKSGQQLVTNQRMKLSDTLYIERATLEDSGIYTMVAESELGADRVNFAVIVAPLVTTPPSKGCPPRVDKFSQSVVTFNDSIKFEWNKVNLVNLVNLAYKVELYVNQSESWKMIAKVAENTVVIKNMKCYLFYTFRVLSTANGCDSQPRDAPPVTVKVGVAEPIPNPITVSELLTDRMTIVWNPTNNECGSRVFEYSIEKQYFNSSKWEPIGRTPAKSREFTDKSLDGVFRYAIKAINGFGESVPFITTYITPYKLLAKCPKKPEGVVDVYGITRNALHLRWDHCIYDKNNANYTFQVERSDSASQIWIELGNTSDYSIFVDQLNCRTEYRFRVKVFTPECETVILDSDPITTLGIPDPPARPISVTVLEGRRIRMSWTLPPLICDTPVMGYTIEKQFNTSDEWSFLGRISDNSFIDSDIEKTYRLKIKSINKYGESAPLITRFVTPMDMIPKKKCPKKPEGIVDVTDLTRDSLVLRWNHTINDTTAKYKFQIEKLQSGSDVWEMLGTTSDYQSVVNQLKCYTAYKFRVKVLTPDCESGLLDSKQIITSGAPESPARPLSLNVLDGGRLTFGWTLPPVVCDAPIAGYIIEKQYNNSGNWSVVGRVNDNNFEDNNIGQTYRYRIKSINKFGESVPLITQFITPMDLIPKTKCPKRPEGVVEATDVTRDSVVLKWGQTIQDKSANYTFQISKIQSYSDVWQPIGSTTEFQTLVKQLKCSTGYRFRVRVKSPDCEVVVIESKQFFTSGDPEPPPGPITYTVLDGKRMNISWPIPPVVCDSLIEGYTIEKQYNGSDVWNYLGEIRDNIYHDIDIGQTYRFRIKSINRYGESVPYISPLVTPSDMIPKIMCPKITERVVNVLNITRNSVILNWKQSIANKNGNYTFEVDKIEPGSQWQTLGQTYEKQTSINQLKCFSDYQFRVKVLITDCETVILESKPIKTSGAPDPPVRPISVVVLDLQKLNLKWTAPPIACDTPLLGFIIERQYNGSEEWSAVSKSKDNGLQDTKISGTFRYRMRAVNKYGESLPLISNFLTPHQMLPKEKCPEKRNTILEVVSLTRQSVKLMWEDLISQKSDKSVSQVQLWETSAGQWSTVGNTSDYSIVINPLNCNTEYKFRVRVLTPDCENITFESKTFPISPLPEAPPPGIIAIVQNYNLMDIQWKASPEVCNAPIEGYNVEKQYDGTQNWIFVDKTLDNKLQDTKIKKSFRFRIRSINKFGESKPLISKSLNPYEMLRKDIERRDG